MKRHFGYMHEIIFRVHVVVFQVITSRNDVVGFRRFGRLFYIHLHLHFFTLKMEAVKVSSSHILLWIA